MEINGYNVCICPISLLIQTSETHCVLRWSSYSHKNIFILNDDNSHMCNSINTIKVEVVCLFVSFGRNDDPFHLFGIWQCSEHVLVTLSLSEADIIILILHMRKLRLKEIIRAPKFCKLQASEPGYKTTSSDCTLVAYQNYSQVTFHCTLWLPFKISHFGKQRL